MRTASYRFLAAGLVLAAALSLAPHAGAIPALVVKAAPSGPNKSTTSPYFVDVPDLSASVPVPKDGRMMITVSAEAGTTNNKRMFVRVLVGGQLARPTDVVFADRPLSGVRSFTFGTDKLPEGTHAVRVQWRVDGGGTAYVGDRALAVQGFQGLPFGKFGPTDVVVAPSGPDKVLKATDVKEDYVDVPNLGAIVASPQGGCVGITVSAEVDSDPGVNLYLRAVVDGKPAEPRGVKFARGESGGVRSFTFFKEGLSFGAHLVKIQWAIHSGTAVIGDRSLAVHAGAVPEQVGHPAVGRSVTDTYWEPNTRTTMPVDPYDKIPTSGNDPALHTQVGVPANAKLKIKVSAEAFVDPGKRLFVRVLVGGKPALPSDVVFAVGDAPRGARSFTFVAAGLPAGKHDFQVQWKTDAGATVRLGCRSLAVLAAP